MNIIEIFGLLICAGLIQRKLYWFVVAAFLIFSVLSAWAELRAKK